jgi:hypothetical protein
MVVHPSPGHLDNTLVNAYLYHCGRSAVTVPAALNLNSNTAAVESPLHNPVVCRGEQDAFETNADEVDDSDADIDDSQLTSTMSSRDVNALLRPGIVHRLDKGVCWSLLAGACLLWTMPECANPLLLKPSLLRLCMHGMLPLHHAKFSAQDTSRIG